MVAAALPDPARLGDRMTGRTCAGTLVTGTGQDGAPRAVYLHHVADNEQTMREDGVQAVVWQTAINPVVALELLAEGTWSGAGVLGPRPSTRRRSWRCWPTTAPRTGRGARPGRPTGAPNLASARRLALGGDAGHRLAAARRLALALGPLGRSGPSGSASGAVGHPGRGVVALLALCSHHAVGATRGARARNRGGISSAAMARVVTFLTDYGYEDEFVGVCHGVIARLAPEVRVIDLTHGVARHDVRSGALILRRALPYFPPGVHLAVVDPGVGGERRAVAARTAEEDRLLVGPDNGLLSLAAARFGGVVEAVDVSRRPTASSRCRPLPRTRHVRAGGGAPGGARRWPRPASRWTRGPRGARAAARAAPRATGRRHALAFDRFGNVMLGVEHEELTRLGLRIGDRSLVNGDEARYTRTFVDVPPGDLLLYEDAYRALSLAVNRGSAADRLGSTSTTRSGSRPGPVTPRSARPRLHRARRARRTTRARAGGRGRAPRHARHRRGAVGRPRAPGPHVVGAGGPRCSPPSLRDRPSCCRWSPPSPSTRLPSCRPRGGDDQVAQRRPRDGRKVAEDPGRGPAAGGLGGARRRHQRRGRASPARGAARHGGDHGPPRRRRRDGPRRAASRRCARRLSEVDRPPSWRRWRRARRASRGEVAWAAGRRAGGGDGG